MLYQLLFDKRLSSRQWLALFVITTGCIFKELHKVTTSSLELGCLPSQNDR